MKLTNEVKDYLARSVLCWLATVSTDDMPNVSPKEIFHFFGEEEIIIANIASPQSAQNIRRQPKVCLSFIDILVQKGYQIKGNADLLTKASGDFVAREEVLLKMTGGAFPFASIIRIKVEQIKPILAPKYSLYPETTEAEQIESAKRAYGF